MGDTQTTFDGLLKQYYDDDRVMNLIYDDNPFLAMVAKDEGFVGDTYKVPIIYSGNNAVGQSFSRAQGQARGTNVGSSSQGVTAFLVSSRAHLYGFTNWSRETMLASATNIGAFMKVATVNMDNILRNLGNRLATALWRNGYGDLANIAVTGFSASATSLTLANPEDVVNFETGMPLDFSATQQGSVRAYGSSGNPLAITGVDRSNGILSFGYAINDGTNGVPGISAGDFIFLYDDAHVSGAAGQTLPIGVEGWIPATVPASTDSFWNVNRSLDSRLSGQRLNATDGRPIEEALIESAQIVRREGGKLSHFFMNHGQYAKLEKQQQGRVIYNETVTDADISFKGITLRTGVGDVICMPDRTVPSNRIYGLELSSWELASLGKMIAPVNEDGLEILRQDSADNFEARYAFYGQPVCHAPGHNINIQVPLP